MDRYTPGDRPWEMVPSKSVKCYDAERTEDHSGDEVQVCRLGCFNAERTEDHSGDEVQVCRLGCFINQML